MAFIKFWRRVYFLYETKSKPGQHQEFRLAAETMYGEIKTMVSISNFSLKAGCLPVAESTVSVLCRKLAINVIRLGRLLKFSQHNNMTFHRTNKTRLRRSQRSQIYFPLLFYLSFQER